MKNRILIFCRGGCIVDIKSNVSGIEAAIVDCDSDDNGIALVDQDGDEYQASVGALPITIEPEEVNDVFRRIER